MNDRNWQLFLKGSLFMLHGILSITAVRTIVSIVIKLFSHWLEKSDKGNGR